MDSPPRRLAIVTGVVNPASIVLFRIAFGAIIVWEAWRYFDRGWIEQIYLTPRFLFTYAGFEWIKPWPGIGLHLHFFAMGLLGAMVAVGLFYRIACVLLCLSLWYVVLLDKAAYLNHLYLAALLAGVFAVVPASVAISVDAWRRPELTGIGVPRWCLSLLRFQVALPYVFGGIAKLNPDWLAGQPMGLWTARMTALHPYVPFLDEPWAGPTMGLLALAFDLLVVPALLWRPSRPVALAAAIAFHAFNAAMFRIGIFPWMMIAATTLFLSPDWPRRYLRLPEKPLDETSATSGPPRWLIVGLALYVVVQLLLPVRHLAYPGRVDWNEEGSRFAWRMMVRDKTGVLQFAAIDPVSGRSQPIDPREFLTPTQIERMGQYPDMLRQFAAFLAETLSLPSSPPTKIRVLSLVSLNGRKPQAMVDAEIDLARASDGGDWIKPLTEPLPEEPWLVPPSEWIRASSDERKVSESR